jgi:galactonate dehydratase
MPQIERISAHPFHVSTKTNWFFIRVECSGGHVGWGEASLNGWEPLLLAATQLRADELTGLTLTEASARVKASPHSPGGLVVNAVDSALQQAFALVEASVAGVPLWRVLGAQQRDRVPVYANINRATTERTPAGFARTAREALQKGFVGFKAAPFDGVTPANCASAEGQALIHQGIERVLAIRDAIGPDARLMVDCHWRFDETRAREVLQALAPARLYWFECPLSESVEHWPALQRIRSAARDQGVLIAAAETQVGRRAFQTLFEQQLYDAVMPDIKYCGGPREMLAIAELAAEHGVIFSPHNPTGPVCTLASLQVAAVAPQCQMLELQYGESPLYDTLVRDQHPTLTGGCFSVPSAAGLGAPLDEALLQAHPYQPVPFGIETLLGG